MGVTNENPSLVRKIAAGSISGGVAAGVTNPLDLIKTRMQSKANPHKTMGASTRAVLAEGGVKGLWRGSGPSMVRHCCLCELLQLQPSSSSMLVSISQIEKFSSTAAAAAVALAAAAAMPAAVAAECHT